MPFQISKESDLLHITLSGSISTADLQAALRELEVTESRQTRIPDRLIDLSAVTQSLIRGDDVYFTATRRREGKYPNPFRSAIVAVQPIQIGFARMFQSYNVHPDITIQVFPDGASALAWLGLPPAAV